MSVLRNHWLWLIFISLVGAGAWLLFHNGNGEPPVTATAEIGTVTSFVSVSGSAEVDDIIPLSFPRGGTVSGLFVARGDTVATGTVLATVGDTTLQADYSAALAEVARVRAQRDQLLSGQTASEAAVTSTTIKNAEAALSTTILTEAAKVETARTTLYSTGLTAVAVDPDTEDAGPTITGSYLCSAAGTYTLELYRSSAESGYSYRYTGIETGTGNASSNQTATLGECGLRLQFPDVINYRNETEFTITIPNTTSPTYATNRALYEQALAQEEANIAAARRTLDLALDNATVATAGARIEELIAAGAQVTAAEARLSQASFALSESALRAPSTGTITDTTISVGQTVATAPVMTLFTPRKTIFTALVPEKDIPEITTDQTATLLFDAAPDETVAASVAYVSPIATTVNGATYYEAELLLRDTPVWLRSGMQADVQIFTEQLTDVVRIPRLYIDDTRVQVYEDGLLTPQAVEVLLVGTDGYVAISGITVGTQLALPTE